MNLHELTEKDYELLLEAVDAWERAPSSDGVLESMVLMTLAPSEVRRSETERCLKAGQSKSAGRKSVAILLRAKLELARQASQAEAIARADEIPATAKYPPPRAGGGETK